MNGMRALHLFAGGGGSVLAGHLLGWRGIGCVEWEPYCVSLLEQHGERVLAQDIRDFDARPLRGHVDLIVGGWPCQDVSMAGKRRGFMDDDGNATRSGLWSEMVRVIDECKPRFVFGENVPGLLTSAGGRDFGTVLHDLAVRGFDAEWGCLRASAVGAPHRRERVWILAHARRQPAQRWGGGRVLAGETGQSETAEEERERHGNTAGDRGEDGGASLAHREGDRRDQGGTQPNRRHPSRGGGASKLEHSNGDAGAGGAVSQRQGGQRTIDATGRGLHRGDGRGPEELASGQGSALPVGGLGGDADGLARWLDAPPRWPAGRGRPQANWEPPRLAGKEKGRVQRLRVLGNGWVPQQAAMAFQLLMERVGTC